MSTVTVPKYSSGAHDTSSRSTGLSSTKCWNTTRGIAQPHRRYRGAETTTPVVVVVVVVFFTLTDRASTIPSNIRGCQSGTWSQRGTKVNGSHHGDNPLLRPTGIQIATKSYATLQAMAPTNIKTVHQNVSSNFLYSISRAASIDSDCCRLPTTSVLSNKSDKHVPTSFDQQFQVSKGYTSYKNKEN